MSAPQPPTNGDQPGTGTDATNGSGQTPAETSATQPSAPAPVKAAPRKAAPRKTAAATGAARKTTTGAGTPRQTTPRTSPKVEAEPDSAAVPDTAQTKVLPTADQTEVLAAATAGPPQAEPSRAEPPQAEVPPTSAPPTAAPPTAAPPTVVPPATEPPQAPPPPPASEQPFTTEPPAAHQATPPARTITEVFADRLDNDGFFSALFDLTFTRYVTRKLAGPVYIVGLVLIGLSTILALIYWLGNAIGTHSFLGAFVFLFGLIITVVGSALAILLLRVAIEVFVAIIAIAENTRPRRKQGP